MPWVRIDEHAMDHPKLTVLSDGAFRLWVRGLAHCQKFLTDGYISRMALKAFRGVTRGRIDELTTPIEATTAPLWEASGDGFQVHDYLVWNDSREHVTLARQYARERLAKYRGKRVANGVQDALETPDTSRNARNTPTKRETQPSAEDGFVEFWLAYPKHVSKSDAAKAWRAIKAPKPALADVLTSIHKQAASEDWRKDGGKFVPYPATWIRARRWEDEIAAPSRDRRLGPDYEASYDWFAECKIVHGGACELDKHRHMLRLAMEKAS